jgi:hypothetical protein
MHALLDSVAEEYARLLDGLDAASSRVHPRDDAMCWCAQELVEHLILTYRSTEGALEERIRKGRPTLAERTSKHLDLWEKTIALGQIPSGGKAPEPVTPGKLHLDAATGSELAAMLRAELARMDGLLDRCEAMFGEKPTASHFIFGPLTAEQWRVFHAVHSRHHLGQLQRILEGLQR